MRMRLTRALVLAATIGLLGACSDDDKTAESTTPAVTFPTGVFIPVDATSASDEGTIEYKADGTWVAVLGDGSPLSDGTYTVSGDQFTWVTDSWCETHSPASNPATYTFSWDGKVLHFTANPADKCADRARTLVVDGKLLENQS